MGVLTKKLRFDDAVVAVIRNMNWSDDGLQGKLIAQLDRKTYMDVNKALEAMGGKWNKKAGAHVFQEDPRGQVEGLLDSGIVVVERDGFFETPREVVMMMLKYAGVSFGRVLEPSAGLGAIADCLPQDCKLVCVERNPQRCEVLRNKGYTTVCGDFMEFYDGLFDTVLMNPPFENGQDARHVMRAYSMLNRRGNLVAIVSGGILQRSDANAAKFQKWINDVDATVVALPDGSFKSSGTMVKTAMICVTNYA